jgi:hypothetical protein
MHALAEVFGEVYCVDVSGEMVTLAREVLRERSNARVYQNKGKDLTVRGGLQFDFAFSFWCSSTFPASP